MTVLEWLEGATRYSFSRVNLLKIACDRGVDPDVDVYGNSVSQEQRDLMEADLIYLATMLSPANTASLQQSHNGYQKTIGAEQVFRQDSQINKAINIYKNYGDSKGDELSNLVNAKKIKLLSIKDVDRL